MFDLTVKKSGEGRSERDREETVGTIVRVVLVRAESGISDEKTFY